jgi:hypothetical protein
MVDARGATAGNVFRPAGVDYILAKTRKIEWSLFAPAVFLGLILICCSYWGAPGCAAMVPPAAEMPLQGSGICCEERQGSGCAAAAHQAKPAERTQQQQTRCRNRHGSNLAERHFTPHCLLPRNSWLRIVLGTSSSHSDSPGCRAVSALHRPKNLHVVATSN